MSSNTAYQLQQRRLRQLICALHVAPNWIQEQGVGCGISRHAGLAVIGRKRAATYHKRKVRVRWYTDGDNRVAPGQAMLEVKAIWKSTNQIA